MSSALRSVTVHLTLGAAQSLVVLVGALVLSVLNVPYMFPGAISELGWQALLAVLVADAVVLGPLLGTRVLGWPRRVPSMVLLAVLIALGGIRGVLLGELLRALGVPGITVERVLIGATLFSAILVLLVIGIDAVYAAVRRQHRIDWLTQAVGETVDGAAEIMRIERERAVADVRSAVQSALDRLAGQTPQAAADDLRTVAHHVVRPLSHALVSSLPPAPARPVKVTEYRLDPRALLSRATASGRVPAVRLGAVAGGVSLTYHLLMPNAGLAWQASVLSGMAVAGLAALCNALFAARLSRLAPVSRGIGLSCELVGIGLVIFAGFWPVSQGIGQFLISNALFTPVVGWALLLTQAVSASHRADQEELTCLESRLEWEVARCNAMLRGQRRQLARVLHGPVQAALNAALVRVERIAGPDVGEHIAAEVTTSVGQALAQLTVSGEPGVNLAVTIQRTQGLWRGVCDVRVMDPSHQVLAVQADPVAAQAIADIVTEGCSNAVRHGRATTVTVQLSRPHADVIRVRITDDGSGLGRDTQAGLGTAMLQAATLSWRRTSDPAGTILQADVPTSIGRVNQGRRQPDPVRIPEQLTALTKPRAEGWV